jgi:hypothetical protein
VGRLGGVHGHAVFSPRSDLVVVPRDLPTRVHGQAVERVGEATRRPGGSLPSGSGRRNSPAASVQSAPHSRRAT